MLSCLAHAFQQRKETSKQQQAAWPAILLDLFSSTRREQALACERRARGQSSLSAAACPGSELQSADLAATTQPPGGAGASGTSWLLRGALARRAPGAAAARKATKAGNQRSRNRRRGRAESNQSRKPA